jgi:hypothetical protein
VARRYGAVCTPDFFGFNRNLELQYRGRLDASGRLPAPPDARRELVEAMRLLPKPVRVRRSRRQHRLLDQVAPLIQHARWRTRSAPALADSELKRMLDACIALVREVAQREIIPRFLRVSHGQRKDDGSLCSEADLAAQHFLVGRLSEITSLSDHRRGDDAGRPAGPVGEDGSATTAACGVSTRSTARPISSTACPVLPFRSPGCALGAHVWR